MEERKHALTVCNPDECVFRCMINNLKSTMVDKKRQAIERYPTASVSKDSLPEGALTFWSRYQGYKDKVNREKFTKWKDSK